MFDFEGVFLLGNLIELELQYVCEHFRSFWTSYTCMYICVLFPGRCSTPPWEWHSEVVTTDEARSWESRQAWRYLAVPGVRTLSLSLVGVNETKWYHTPPPPPLLPRTSHLLAATAWQMPAMSPVPGGNNCMKCGLAKGVRMCREYCVTHTLCLHQRVELFSLTSKLRYPLCVTHIQVAKP